MSTTLMLVSLLSVGASGQLRQADALAALCRPVMQRGAAIDLVGTRYAPEQARDPGDAVGKIDARQSMLLLSDGRYMVRTSTVYPGDIEFRFRSVGSPVGEDTIDELGWRDGDALLHDDASSATKDGEDYRMLVPDLLACEALRAGRSAGDQRIDITGADSRAVILRLDDKNTIVEAAIGAEVYRYEGWHNANGVATPAMITRTRDGHLVAHWTDIRVRSERDTDSALLKLPSGYRPPEPTGPLRATPIGHSAYRIDGTPSGYHTGFVVGDRAIALFDAPIGIAEARTVRALIEKTAPGRKIAYVVVSHVHGDHVAGLPAYPDAEILTGPGGILALRRQFPDLAATRVRELREPTTIDLGGRPIDLYPISSTHSTTMLLGYDPKTRALFQGDLPVDRRGRPRFQQPTYGNPRFR